MASLCVYRATSRFLRYVTLQRSRCVLCSQVSGQVILEDHPPSSNARAGKLAGCGFLAKRDGVDAEKGCSFVQVKGAHVMPASLNVNCRNDGSNSPPEGDGRWETHSAARR